MSLNLYGIGGAVGGAVSTVFFQRPTFTKAAVTVLVSGALLGTAIQVASVFLTNRFLNSLKTKDPQTRIFAYFGSYAACGVVLTLASKAFMNYIGLSINNKQAGIHFAFSSVVSLVVNAIFNK